MKKCRICAAIFALALLFSITATAVAPRASNQIGSYDIIVTPQGRGKISIDFSVDGVGSMRNIGASKIVVYQSQGSSTWRTVKVFDKFDSGMTKSDINKYGSTVYFSGVSGEDYRVTVTIFAEDYSGNSDSRTQTFYVTA